MINWKIIAGFAGFAVFVSLLAGLIGGVGIGDLFLRCLLWGLLFGALGFGILFLVNRFFPELADAFSTPKPVSSEQGGEVDIMLPDENPHLKEGRRRAAVNEGEDYDELEEEISDDNSDDNDEYLSDESDDSSEELSEDFKSEKVRDRIRAQDDNPEALEEISGDPFGGDNETDSLPDLDKFSGSFMSFDNIEAVASEGSVMNAKESVDVSGTKQDPKKMAKALHTWIERDKEG